ncbi:hypothetical protein FGO68_gene2718 [Halteria grandinella]|uniref:Uncharacterized protein n=1 Tax=Halteria grandinella TaxID=5974 RepID=A0A8J8T371_HALGN|nr:hypothetical protein FGO68_gene2718 [Halteria grandinella]
MRYQMPFKSTTVDEYSIFKVFAQFKQTDLNFPKCIPQHRIFNISIKGQQMQGISLPQVRIDPRCKLFGDGSNHNSACLILFADFL